MANQYTSKFPDRFWNKVEKGDTCWIWTARKNKYGYGEISYNNTVWKAHRLSYLINYGDFDKDLYISHICDNPSCVNPKHLFLSTQKQNMEDMVKKKRHGNFSKELISYDEWLLIRPNKSKKDLCKKGHELSDENTRIKKGSKYFVRLCRTCQYATSKSDIVAYKVKGFVRGVKNRKEVVLGIIDKVYSLGVQCLYCGGNFECLDHFISKKDGGKITIENINPSCNDCNQKRKRYK